MFDASMFPDIFKGASEGMLNERGTQLQKTLVEMLRWPTTDNDAFDELTSLDTQSSPQGWAADWAS
eukprot:2857638-Karenia_brevis.AAC.1